jgi:DNA gyrase inhibitor GyrI
MDTGGSTMVVEFVVDVKEFSKETYALFEQIEPEAATTMDGYPVDMNPAGRTGFP